MAFDCDSRVHRSCRIEKEVKIAQEAGIVAKHPLTWSDPPLGKDSALKTIILDSTAVMQVLHPDRDDNGMQSRVTGAHGGRCDATAKIMDRIRQLARAYP